VGDKLFRPFDPITREQFVTILYRYAKNNNYSMDIKSDALDTFDDETAISGYARDGMIWACSEGILRGDAGKLRPAGSTTRAEMVAMLHRFLNINVQG